MNKNILNSSYYNKFSTLELSKNLLGKILVHKNEEGITSGIIVETEAYLQDDPACHAYKKITLRNESMFQDAGTAYVYFIYGNYFCINIVSNKSGIGEAVLIRALEPLKRSDLMRNRLLSKAKIPRTKNYDLDTKLCNGPGKLCTAMGISKKNDGTKMYESESLYIKSAHDIENDNIVTTTRIGITKGVDLAYRFYIKGNKFISKKGIEV